MSTPAAAGAIALWLQACPTLTPDQVRELIAATSRRHDPSLDYPNNYYGYGEIDVYAGLLRLLGFTAIPDVSQRQAQGVAIRPVGDGQLSHLAGWSSPWRLCRPGQYRLSGYDGFPAHQTLNHHFWVLHIASESSTFATG